MTKVRFTCKSCGKITQADLKLLVDIFEGGICAEPVKND